MKTVPRKVAPGCCRNVLKAKRRRWVLGPRGVGGGGEEGAPGVSRDPHRWPPLRPRRMLTTLSG